MASQSYDPQDDWRGCISARVIPLDTVTNADMSGIMVVVAGEPSSPCGYLPRVIDRLIPAVVVNFCLREFGVFLDLARDGKLTFALYPGIQMGFSVESVDTGAISTIAQLYSILLSTLLSIDRQQLSLFDANCALMVTSSPFTMYLVFSSICDLLGFETGLFRRIQSHRHIISAFGALLLPIWFGLRLTIRLSDKAFQDSGLCGDPTPKDLLLDFLLLFAPLTGPVGGFWIAQVYLIVLVTLTILVGSIDLVASFLIGREGASGPWERLCKVWVVMKGGWCVPISVCAPPDRWI